MQASSHTLHTTRARTLRVVHVLSSKGHLVSHPTLVSFRRFAAHLSSRNLSTSSLSSFSAPLSSLRRYRPFFPVEAKVSIEVLRRKGGWGGGVLVSYDLLYVREAQE